MQRMRTSGSEGHGRHMPEVGEYSPQEATREIVEWFPSPGRYHRLALIIAVTLFVAGLAAFIARAVTDGFDDRAPWAYYAAAFAFLLATVGSAPLVAITMRYTRSHWRRGISRSSELFAFCGPFLILMYIPLVFLLPVTDGRKTIWINWHGHAPHIYDTLALVTLVLLGLVLLYVAAIPDFATLRDHGTGPRQRLYERLARGWSGSKHQWHLHRAALALLGTFYFMLLIFTQFLISTDFAMSLVPGWKDAIYPTFYALTGLQGAVATVVLASFAIRGSGLGRYIYLDHFWALGKLLLALSLLWFYFWWSGFIVYWYGRAPAEQGILNYLMKDTYYVAFLLAILLCFVIPAFGLLAWNPIRKSIVGPVLAAGFVLAGNFMARVREFVGGFSIPDEMLQEKALPLSMPANLPDVLDVLLVLGALGGALMFYLLAMRLIPAVSLWEHKELALLRKVRPYLRRYVVVIGKPD